MRSGGRIGIRVPGVYLPCLYGLGSTVILEEIGADAAVVEQRVALCRARRSRLSACLPSLHAIRNVSS